MVSSSGWGRGSHGMSPAAPTAQGGRAGVGWCDVRLTLPAPPVWLHPLVARHYPVALQAWHMVLQKSCDIRHQLQSRNKYIFFFISQLISSLLSDTLSRLIYWLAWHFSNIFWTLKFISGGTVVIVMYLEYLEGWHPGVGLTFLFVLELLHEILPVALLPSRWDTKGALTDKWRTAGIKRGRDPALLLPPLLPL